MEVAGPPDATGRWDVTKVQKLTTASTVLVLGGRRSKATTVVLLVVVRMLVLLDGMFVLGVVASLASS